jgi:hypothetical protein
MIVETRVGDVRDCPVEYTVGQQCNCLTTKPHGLSQSIAEKWPWADVYGKRPKGPKPNVTTVPAKLGTCSVLAAHFSARRVVNMFAQWFPGIAADKRRYPIAAKYPPVPAAYGDDSAASRLRHFRACCKCIDDDSTITQVAVPKWIGCGLGGGNWTDYERVLAEMTTEVYIYVLPKP